MLLPVQLSGEGVFFLLRNDFPLHLDGLIKTVEKSLVVAPFMRRQPVLGHLLEAQGVFVAVLLQHGQFVARILLGGNQARQLLRRLVGSRLHQFKDGLQRERAGHVALPNRPNKFSILLA